jgi:hypothetical protein
MVVLAGPTPAERVLQAAACSGAHSTRRSGKGAERIRRLNDVLRYKFY